MKKKLLPLLLVPVLLTSCGRSSLSLERAEEIVAQYSVETKYPYYKVIGALDFNGEITVADATFDREPETNKFVPYSRYNDGFFNARADSLSDDFDILIYAMASRSYWLRAPLRINPDNFFAYAKDKTTGEYTDIENSTCAHYILEHLITSFVGKSLHANPGNKHMYIEELSDGGIAFGGDAVHTNVFIDNYPFYPDYNNNPEMGTWNKIDPLPCYKNSVDAKVNIRFEYNGDGWLVKESMSSVGYNKKVASKAQVSLEAIYVYDFGPENP